MLTIKNRVITATINTVALLSVVAPAFLLAPAAEAAVATVVAKQSGAGNLIADRYDDDYGYSYRHGRPLYRGRHHRHHHKKFFKYNNSYYQPPAVIYNKPVGIFAPQPQVIYAPQERRCVRTLYSTICN